MRGQGRVFHPTWTDAKTGTLMVARVWALDYSINGTRHREPANTTSKTVAQRLLRQRIGDRETRKVIGNFRGVWLSACKRAGLDGRLVHDLRRTAARDLRRAGVSEGEIMRLCGWKTRAMFDRYNIIDEQDLAAAVAKRFANGQGTAKLEGAAAQAGTLS